MPHTPFASLEDYIALPRVDAVALSPDGTRAVLTVATLNKDETGYSLKPETIPEYQLVLREKVLTDIKNDPLWYLGILLKRTNRIFNPATPVRLGLGSRFIDIPFSTWLVLAMLPCLLLVRRWEQLKLLIFYAPTSLPALLIFSFGGFTNPTAFHLVAFALISCWVVHAATGLVTNRTHQRALKQLTAP